MLYVPLGGEIGIISVKIGRGNEVVNVLLCAKFVLHVTCIMGYSRPTANTPSYVTSKNIKWQLPASKTTGGTLTH